MGAAHTLPHSAQPIYESDGTRPTFPLGDKVELGVLVNIVPTELRKAMLCIRRLSVSPGMLVAKLTRVGTQAAHQGGGNEGLENKLCLGWRREHF